MNLGFIGTGKITSSVITGICNSKFSYKKILISPRNKNIRLNEQYLAHEDDIISLIEGHREHDREKNGLCHKVLQMGINGNILTRWMRKNKKTHE